MKTKFFGRNGLTTNLFFIWLTITGFFYPGSLMGQTVTGESQITEIDRLKTKIEELKNQIIHLTATRIQEVSRKRVSDKIAVFKISLEKCGYIKMSLTKEGTDDLIPGISNHFANEHIIKFDNLEAKTRYSYKVQLIDKNGSQIIMSDPETGTFRTEAGSPEKKCYKIVCNDDNDKNFTATAWRTNGDERTGQEKYLLEIKIFKKGDQRNTYEYIQGKWFSGNNGQGKIYVEEGSSNPRITIPWEKFKFSGEFLVHGFLYNDDGTKVYEDLSLSGITKEEKKIEKPKFISPVTIEFTPIDTIISWKSDTKANSHIEIKRPGHATLTTESQEDKEMHTHYLLKSGYYEKVLSQKKLNLNIIMENPEDNKMRNEKEIVISFDYPRNEEGKKTFVEATTEKLKTGVYKDVNKNIKNNIIATLRKISKVRAKKLKKLL
ncbi:MAG: hypothetical protein PVH61_39570 [Candidatus Aminicenantes bacterium]